MDNYNYPEGSDTSSAPWNQVELPEKEFTVTATFSLDREVKVHTSDYTQDVDWDEDSGKVACIDTSNTNWVNAYLEEHETVEDLLIEFRTLLEAKIEECKNFSKDDKTLERYKYLKSECEGWITHDFEVVE